MEKIQTFTIYEHVCEDKVKRDAFLFTLKEYNYTKNSLM